MPVDDDGFFEVLLSGRQLLGVLVAVLVLMTVAFLIGQTTARAVAAGPEKAVRKTERAPILLGHADVHPPAPPAAPAGPSEAASEPKPVAKTAPAKPSVEPEPEIKPVAKAVPEGATPVSGGLYLQVAAGGKVEAVAFQRRLVKKSFEVICAPVLEKPGLFRVLVGPLKDSSSVAQTREGLTEAGFNGHRALLRRF